MRSFRLPSWWHRFRARSRGEVVRREVEVREARNPVERELLAHDIGSYKEDVYASAGDGSIAATLPTVPADELYEEFERDESEPDERAP